MRSDQSSKRNIIYFEVAFGSRAADFVVACSSMVTSFDSVAVEGIVVDWDHYSSFG